MTRFDPIKLTRVDPSEKPSENKVNDVIVRPQPPVRLYDPASFEAPETWTWQPLLMVSNVPHVAAEFAGAPGGGPQIFMIDSGAGGADCIFHARAVEELGLRRLLPPVKDGQSRSSSRVRGVGGRDIHTNM